MQLSPFHKLLKEKTSTYHDDLEKELLVKKIFNSEISKEEYILYLELFLQIHKEVETELLKFDTWNTLNFDLKSYFREKLILKDLEILKAQINLKKSLKLKIENFSESLGFLYVLTGSTMGGSILSKKIEETFKDTQFNKSNNYFNAFGEKNHPMFFTLMKLIETYTNTHQNHNDIIKGAINCYIMIKKSFQVNDN